MDYEQLLGAAVLILIVGFPLLILLLGPTLGKDEKIQTHSILPLLMEAIKEYATLEAMRHDNYETFEDEVIRLLFKRVQAMDALEQFEKEVLTHEALRLLVGPYLKKVFKK